MESWMKLFEKTKKKQPWFIILGIAAVIILAACSTPAEANTTVINNVSGKMIQVSESPQSNEVVTVGLYAVNLFDLQTAGNTFYYNGYMWYRWSGDTDPLRDLEFTNAVAGPFVKQPLYPEPVILPNGEKYQVIRLQGRFYDLYDLSNYPLDKQELSITMENSVDGVDIVAYVPDSTSSGFDDSMKIPGWHINSLIAKEYIHDYGTDFGMLGDPSVSKYSTLEFAFSVLRNQNQFYWKFLFPLLIVLFTCWLCLVISPEMGGLRTGMPVSVLLTMVFLHLGTKGEIPAGAGLVLADKIYMLSYVMILATLGQIIWVNMNFDADGKSNLAEMKRADRTGLIIQVVVFVTVLAYLIFTAIR